MQKGIMWLPEAERKLLTIYYLAVSETLRKVESSPATRHTYDLGRLVRIFDAKCFYKKAAQKLLSDSNEQETPVGNTKRFKKFLANVAAIDAANAALQERKLIKFDKRANSDYDVTLTVEAYDLGRKYSSWLLCSGLWFEEYKKHWIIAVACFFGGIIGVELVKYLIKLFRSN